METPKRRRGPGRPFNGQPGPGRPRTKNPLRAHAEKMAVRDAREEIKQAMQLALRYAPEVLLQLAFDALDKTLEPEDRHRAAKLLLDRAMGGDPQAAVAVFAGVEREAARLNVLNVGQPIDLVPLLDAVLGRQRLINGEP